MIASHDDIAELHSCGCTSKGGSGTATLAASQRPVDLRRIERAVREILIAVGEDPDRDGLLDTPKRVAKAYAEIFAGLRQDPGEHLARVFDQRADEMVTVTNIDVHSVCEHHLLPFFGKAHVAYLPGSGKVVGVSKLARTVEVFARRPQIQERLTDQIADALMEHLDAAGAIVIVEAEHMCMRMRGVRSADSRMTTVARRGVYKTDEAKGRDALAFMRSAAKT